MWVGGCGTAGNWNGQIELRVTNDREDGGDCGIKAEQGEGVSGIPELFRGAELLAGDMERLETLCHWSASVPFYGRQVSLTSLIEAIQNVTFADSNTCSSTVCQSAPVTHLLISLRGYKKIKKYYIYIYICICISHWRLICCNEFLPSNDSVCTRSPSK